jgi:hypothetical protein
MRNFGIVAGCVWLAMVLSGCDPNDRAYFRGGVGTELYTVDTATVTELQNVYLDLLCRQSRPLVGAAVPSCSEQQIAPSGWPIIVLAGMNDIDQRCDAYLSWLDQKKRETAGILAEIAAIRVAVDAITNPAIATSISPLGLAAIAAAFGLATSTFNNINSLLLQVDHTTVQSVVFINRRKFRERLLDLPIDNKPIAVHALRSYLEICMPMTISANINATVTVFQQGGAGALSALGGGQSLVSTSTIGRPLPAFTPREKFIERKPQGKDADLPRVPGAETIIDGYPANARTYTREVIANLLNGLCAPATELNGITAVSQSLLDIWERTETEQSTADGKITDRERKVLGNETCAEGILNAFERRTFTTPEDVALLVGFLIKAPVEGQLDAAATLAQARTRIGVVRQRCFAGKLKSLPSTMMTQVTPDLMSQLRAYAKRRAVVEAQGSPAPAC